MSTPVFPALLIGDGRIEAVADSDDFRVLLELSSGVDLRGDFYARASFVDAELFVHRVRKLRLTSGGFLTWMKRRRIQVLEMDREETPLELEELRALVLDALRGESALWPESRDIGSLVQAVSAATSLSDLRAVFERA